METAKEALVNAETAFFNKRFQEALDWYQRVLSEEPDNTYALSRAGAICVSIGQFERALEYFEHAKKLDEQNGDNYFNYGNACFFKKDFAGAFASYVEAEKIGCSDDVMPRLFYQMALLCSLRQDTKSALVYFKKCEDCDTTGEISLNPDLISEKLKLYMITEDYVNAEKMAAQLVAIQPTLFRNYMVYFSILLAHKKYTAAERLLADAERFAELTHDDQVNIHLQIAALHVAKGEADPISREDEISKAIELLESQACAEDLGEEQLVNILMTLSEVYQKADLHDKAISCLGYMLGAANEKEPVKKTLQVPISELSPEEIDEMIRLDMERVQEMIDTGEIDANLGAYSQVEYDESGFPVNVYDDEFYAALSKNAPTASEKKISSPKKKTQIALSTDQRERVYFLLLSSYLAKDEFKLAGQIADILKNSSNKHYAYYGRYISALATQKLHPKSATAARVYAETIAFFRNKMFSDHSDSLAAIFRSRLYAEEGKFEKAKEISELLSDSDRKSIADYIETLISNQ